MSAFTDQLAKDFRQVALQDLPVSFRFRNRQYDNASFNAGEGGYDPVSGGIIEDLGIATLMYAVADLPKREPEEAEDISVLYGGRWKKYVVKGYNPGHAVATLTLVTPEKP